MRGRKKGCQKPEEPKGAPGECLLEQISQWHDDVA